MTRPNLTPADSNTPWWYQTPSLVSQSSYGLSSFTGVTMSQSTDPLDGTLTSDSSCFTETPNGGNRGQEDESDEGSPHSFLITTVESDTGQSSFFLSSDLESVARQKRNPSNSSFSNTAREGQSSTIPRSRSYGKQSPAVTTLQVAPPMSNRFHSTTNICDTRIEKSTEHSGTHRGRLGSWSGKEHIKETWRQSEGEGSVKDGSQQEGGPHAVNRSQLDKRQFTDKATSDISDRLTSASPSSDCSGESLLSHSTSSANQDILSYLRPQLMQCMNPNELLPHLVEHNLLNQTDLKYIMRPQRTDKEKKKRILACAPLCNFDLFVECLVAEKNDPGHLYLVKRLREAIEKKRNHPFKRLSSFKNAKSRNVSASKPSPSTAKQRSRDHKITPRASSSPAPVKVSADKVPYNPILESLPLVSGGEETDKFSYETFTLPRKSIVVPDSRGSKPYSSARYPSSTIETNVYRKRSKITRHSSFQGAADGHIHVSPMIRDPLRLSEENSDILENLSHFKVSEAPSSACYRVNGGDTDGHLYDTVEDSLGHAMMPSPLETEADTSRNNVDQGENIKWDSLRRGSNKREPGPRSTIHEIDSDINKTHGTSNHGKSDTPQYDQKSRDHMPSLSGDGKSKQSPLSTRRLNSDNIQSKVPMRKKIASTPAESFDHLSQFSSEVQVSRHSSMRRDSPKHTQGSVPLRRGMSLHGVTDSQLRHSPALSFEPQGSYKPSSLTPASTSTKVPDKSAPPVPIKQAHTHRRTQSYDISQVNVDYMPVTLPTDTSLSHFPKSLRRLSLRHDTPSSSTSFGRRTVLTDVQSPVTIVTTRDSALSYTANGSLRSASGYNLSSSPAYSQRRASTIMEETGTDTLTSRRLEWLQEKVQFKTTPDDIVFKSRTHYDHAREVINSGTLFEGGRARFLVLLTDMLIILKPKKKGSILPSRLASMLSVSQTPQIDWFSDMESVSKMPMLLYHLSVRSLSKRKEPQVLYLHYDDRYEMKQITLHAVSGEAKDIWVDTLNKAIVACTRAHAKTQLSEGNEIDRDWNRSTCFSKLSLTIVQANNLAVTVDCQTRNHFCTVQLGNTKCKTPNMMAQCWPSWDYKIDFVDFALTETVLIEFYTERITSPNEFLGCVDIQIMAVAQRLKVNLEKGVSTLQLKNQHLPLKNGKGTLTLDFELGWVNNNLQ